MREDLTRLTTPYLNMRELLTGAPNRLRYVIRFSTCYRLHDESVAEHSYYTALYAMMIAEWLHSNTELQVDRGLLAQSALIHDLEESRSGDFPRPFKHSNPELARHLNEAGELAFRQTMRGLLLPADLGVLKFLNEELEIRRGVDEWSRRWLWAKDPEQVEGLIIEYADFLSCASYLCQEIKGANRTMGEHTETMGEYFTRFESAEYDFIRPLVVDTNVILRECFPDSARYHEGARK